MTRTLLAALALTCVCSSAMGTTAQPDPFGAALEEFGPLVMAVPFAVVVALVLWCFGVPVLNLFRRSGIWFPISGAVALSTELCGPGDRRGATLALRQSYSGRRRKRRHRLNLRLACVPQPIIPPFHNPRDHHGREP